MPDTSPVTARESPEPDARVETPAAHPWEVELLVSGATAFALLQLPPKLDALYYELANRSPRDIAAILSPGWIYLKTSLFILIFTFIIHLVLRGYWVALVGLNSIYPGGIRWEKFSLGPHQRSLLEKEPSFAARIRRADMSASFVFAIGFALSTVLLVPTLLVLIGLAVLLGAHAAGVPSKTPALIVFGIFVVLLMPLQALVLIDRRFGKNIPAGSQRGRLLSGALAFYERIGLGRARQPLLLLYRSHTGATGVILVIALGMAVAFGTLAFAFVADSNRSLGYFAGLPDDLPESADNLQIAHYASLRGSDFHSLTPRPFIPDPVVSGPYLQLFVPYRIARVEPALRERCTAQVAQAESGGSPRAALDCLATLFDVHIDGAAIQIHFDAATDPVNNTRGVEAMIPVSELPAGRHQLSMRELPDPREAGSNKTEVIPFWR